MATALALYAGLVPVSGQSPLRNAGILQKAEASLDAAQLARHVGYLSSECCEGRGTAQRGGTDAAWWISRQFGSYGLVPFGQSFVKSFREKWKPCHNVVGMIPATTPGSTRRYIIIGAHYDGIGMLDGNIYPGADSNASGVAALLALADMFRQAAAMGADLGQNIIFVAFDAKQLSMAGSADIWNRISQGRLIDPYTRKAITAKDITMMVNLDILGGNSSPIHKVIDEYMLLLGAKEADQLLLHKCNRRGDRMLDLGFDYYGSPGFTDMFLKKVSDQKVFLDHGIYSVMFTSGISMDTNRLTDTPDKVIPELLERRTKLIYRWICEKLMQTRQTR